MYDRFTDCARKVIQLANQEAKRFHHEYIGTAQILLGLIKEGSGVAVNVLKNLHVDLKEMRLEIERRLEKGPNVVTMFKLPMTPKAKKVIEYAMEEARLLNHNYVGSEHLLLGLLREEEDVAAQVLAKFGLTLEAAREETLNLLGRGLDENDAPEPDPAASTSSSGTTDRAVALDKQAATPGTFASRLFTELFSSFVVAGIIGLVSQSWTVFNVCWGLLAVCDVKRAAWPPK